jgi:hypothetical protein
LSQGDEDGARKTSFDLSATSNFSSLSRQLNAISDFATSSTLL